MLTSYIWSKILAFSSDFLLRKGRSYFPSGPMRYILDEWKISSYTLAQSGFPLGVIDNACSNYLLQGRRVRTWPRLEDVQSMSRCLQSDW
jgi:hypothetical protein